MDHLFLDDYFVAALLDNAMNGKQEEQSVSAEEPGFTEDQPDSDLCTKNRSAASALTNAQHMWQYNATAALIRSMQVHVEDLHHPKKRKHVYENCMNDLLSQGFIVTANQCQAKWKSLIRSYQSSKDNQSKTGRGPSRFQFFDEMDAILGRSISIKITGN